MFTYGSLVGGVDLQGILGVQETASASGVMHIHVHLPDSRYSTMEPSSGYNRILCANSIHGRGGRSATDGGRSATDGGRSATDGGGLASLG